MTAASISAAMEGEESVYGLIQCLRKDVLASLGVEFRRNLILMSKIICTVRRYRTLPTGTVPTLPL